MAWLQEVQRAGYERHDLTTYMSQWAPGATLTAARAATPGPHDRTLTLDAIRATRTERYFKPPTDKRTLRWQDVRVRVAPPEPPGSGQPPGSARRATVTWLALSTHEDGSELIAERYELRQTGGSWRVTRNRFWPVWTLERGHKKRVFSPAVWRKLDAWASRQACFGGPCPSRLLTGWRFVDAWKAAVRISERPGGASGHAWLLRGICAVLAGQVADARPSFEKARALDKAIQFPPWRSAQEL